MNQQIRAASVRLIDDEGGQAGVVPISDALMRAREKNLDLVEVSPLANPPVCKIVDWGAFQYQQDKAERKQKAKQKSSEIKGIRISLKISEHDLATRVEQSKKFLERGDRVKLEMILRGREQQFQDRAKEKIVQFIASLGEDAYQDGTISKTGNRLSVIIGKKK